MPKKKIAEIFRFGISGIVGFVVDAGIVLLITRELRLGPIVAQIIAFTVAVTVTWIINRHWTFAEQASENWLHEWSKYVAANLVGAIVNNGVYGSLVLTMSTFSNEPVLAVAAGSLAGMGFNFGLSKFIVFRSIDIISND